MAPRPRVPFTLSPALRLVQNVELTEGYEVALSPDGAVAGVVRGDWNQRRVELHDLATGAVEEVLPATHGQNVESLVWSRDGRRWAVSELRFEGQARRGVIRVGERGRDELLCTAETSAYCGILRNALVHGAPMLAFSPEGDRVVLRTTASDDRNALMHVSVSEGAVREQWLDPSEGDLYAHAFGDDGTLYTASADPGDHAGLAWYPPGAGAPSGRLAWVFGFAILPAKRGIWVAGSPRYCFRVAPGEATELARATPPRGERAEALRARASAKWDQQYLDDALNRLAAGWESFNYCPARGSFRAGSAPPPTAGMRCLENDLLWETSFAARMGDDDLVVSDGVGVWRWRDDGAALTRDLLLDDTARCTHRGARIVGLSAAGDTLAILWKKDARGQKTVLSRFEIDRAAR